MIPNVPSKQGKSLAEWQDDVGDFLRAVKDHVEATNPIQLSAYLGNESAAIGGILMYDFSAGRVVVSDGTQFKQLEYVP